MATITTRIIFPEYLHQNDRPASCVWATDDMAAAVAVTLAKVPEAVIASVDGFRGYLPGGIG
jgi:hypothetical protein